MKKFAVIVAGGRGQRMGAALPKQFLLLHGKPLLWYSLKIFLETYSDIKIILVLPEEYFSEGNNLATDLKATEKIQLVKGGATRFHSVKNGLQYVEANSIVFVHDGVRCLLDKDLIERCYYQAVENGSAIPAISATDSIRIVEGGKNFVVDRNNVRIIQTPQTFKSEILLKAFQQEYQESFTDEATVVEASGENIFLVEGNRQNIKITLPVDLLIAEKILEEKLSF